MNYPLFGFLTLMSIAPAGQEFDGVYCSTSLSSPQQPATKAAVRTDFDLVDVPLECYGQHAVVRLPSGFAKPQQHWYEEGYMLFISYPDQSHITILCGSNAVLTIPKKARRGLRYRKEYCAQYGFTITYSRVPADKVATFDYAFDQLMMSEK